MKPSHKLPITGVLLALAAGSLMVLYYSAPGLRDTLEFATAVAGGSAALFGLAYGFHRASIAALRSRRQRSLEIIDQLNRPELVRTSTILATGIRESGDARTYIGTDVDRYADSLYLLGILEDIALSIRAEVADERLLHDSLSLIVTGNYDLFASFIQGMRAERKDNTVFAELQALADAWRDGRSLCTRHQLPRLTEGDSNTG